MHFFIINPAAGGKLKNVEKTASHIRTIADSQGIEYDIYVTKGPMDACEKIKEIAPAYSDLRIYACGGDGTLNECVNGAAGLSNVSVTHFPCGTGNDFIKMFGSDSKLFHNLPALINGTRIPMDLIECNGRYSINICSVGIDACIGADVHKYSQIPIIGGATGYVVSLFVNLIKGINFDFNIISGAFLKKAKYTLVCACNGQYYGGGFNPVPDARPDDGIIDFLIVKAVSRLKFLKVVQKYASGKYKELTDIITHVRGNHMEIKTDSNTVINIDGEIITGKDIFIKMVSNGINFIFPKKD